MHDTMKNQMIRMSLFILLLAMVTSVSGQDTFEWTNPSSGFFSTSGNWTRTSGTGTAPPGIGDTAIFNEFSLGYQITFFSTTFSDSVQVTNGLVVFSAFDPNTVRTYIITSGAADLLVSGGAILQVSNSTKLINLIIADDLIVAGGAASMSIRFGSSTQCTDLLLGTLGDGEIEVIGSTFTVVGASSQNIGAGPFAGSLTYSNSSTGTMVGTTLIGTSGSGADADSSVIVDDSLVTMDSIVVGGGPHIASSGLLLATSFSAATQITQTAGSTLIVGGPLGTGAGRVLGGSFAPIFVGATTINPTGSVKGTINFTDTVLVDGGELCGSALSFVPGSTIPFINGANFGLGSCDANIVDGVTIHLHSGSDMSLHDLMIGSDSGTTGEVILDGSGCFGLITEDAPGSASLSIGNSTRAAGRLQVINGAQFDTGTGLTTIESSGLLVVDAASGFGLHGELFVDGGTLQNPDGVFTADSGINWSIQNSGLVDLPPSGPLSILSGVVWDVNTGGTLNLPAVINLDTGGSLDINAGTVSLGGLNINGGLLNLISGNLSMSGDLNLDGNILVGASQSIAVGGATTILGLDTLTIDGGTFTSHALNLDTFSTLDYQSGTFSTTGPIFALGGSLLNIEGGNASLGDPTVSNGFYCNGNLDIWNNTVTLNDSDAAVFDVSAMVTLGAGAPLGGMGTIVAPNGLTLNMGATVLGTGIIDTPDTPASPLFNNGNITGNSPSEMIELLGHVKGVGTFDHVEFLGTFDPGFSPAAINLGSATYSGTLAIEIGGPTPGSDHDQLNHILSAGVANLGGTLEIVLLNGFAPTTGQEFIIMTGTQILGQFDQVIKPGNLEVVYGSNQVIVRGFCAADVSGGDNTVNVTDLLSLLAAWGPCGAPCPPDINSDGNVNVTDLLALLAGWGACP